jgi:hypothetical protein
MSAKISAANLRFRVRFDKKVTQDDPGGGVLSAWSTDGTGSIIRWADIRPLKGGENVQQERLQGTQPVIIVARADSDTKTIDTSWRAVRMIDGVDQVAYALKTAQDMEMENRFITFMGVSGEADS